MAKYETTFRSILRLIGARKDATSPTILGFVNRPLWIEDILQENQ